MTQTEQRPSECRHYMDNGKCGIAPIGGIKLTTGCGHEFELASVLCKDLCRFHQCPDCSGFKPKENGKTKLIPSECKYYVNGKCTIDIDSHKCCMTVVHPMTECFYYIPKKQHQKLNKK